MSDMEQTIRELCQKASMASRALANASGEKRNELISEIANGLEAASGKLAAANQKDLQAAEQNGLSAAMIDRLALNEQRITKMIQGARDVVDLTDPVGEVTREWELYNGIEMKKVRVPIGVIGIIYESRPNVTVDAGVLCLKTGNVPVLRGGKEAFESNCALIEVMQQAAVKVGLPAEVISFIPTTDREAIPAMCRMDQYIDLMIPRGGHGLIQTVVEHARMPVIKHFHGVCHVYVHADADLEMARNVVVNSKCQRPGVCNALETLLVDQKIAHQFLPEMIAALKERGVEVRGDAAASEAAGETLPEPEGWDVEYLDLILGLRVVEGMADAIKHMEQYGSHHTETIITKNKEIADEFLARVDSAAVFWNASTRFSDGGQFGFGAEIGISTDKIHARGPMGLEELTIYKYVGRGNGQTRI
ncbi:MAG: glutamate-5-semialdehyde dehydrogenase [Verrucomicrobiota bacterium]